MVKVQVDIQLFKKAVGGAVGLIGILMLGGCQMIDRAYQREDLYTGSIYKFADTNHPIKVDRGNLTMGISVGPNDRKLLPQKRDELVMYLHYFRDQGTGYLHVDVPRNGRSQKAIDQAILAMQHEMEHLSIGPESLRVRKYQSRDAYPVIKLSFERYVAHASKCRRFNQNLGQDENNGNSDYWGCATQNNLAAMVANPRDLKGPRGWSPRDARRRDTIWEKFIKGDPSGAKRSIDERTDTRKDK